MAPATKMSFLSSGKAVCTQSPSRLGSYPLSKNTPANFTVPFFSPPLPLLQVSIAQIQVKTWGRLISSSQAQWHHRALAPHSLGERKMLQ